MCFNEANTSQYHAIDLALKKENRSKLITGEELYYGHQKRLNKSSKPISLAAFLSEIASEFPAHPQREYERRYLIHKRLMLGAGLSTKMLAEIDPGLLAKAAEADQMNSHFLRTIIRRLYDETRQGRSHQRLEYLLNAGLQLGRDNNLSYSDKTVEDILIADFDNDEWIIFEESPTS